MNIQKHTITIYRCTSIYEKQKVTYKYFND